MLPPVYSIAFDFNIFALLARLLANNVTAKIIKQINTYPYLKNKKR